MQFGFDIKVDACLVSGGDTPEGSVLFSAYLTKDLSTKYVLHKANSFRSTAHGKCIFDVSEKSLMGPLARDAALCVQGFATILNKNGQKCMHRIGAATIPLLAMRNNGSEAILRSNLYNHAGNVHERGKVTVTMIMDTTNNLRKLQFAEPTDLDLVQKNISEFSSSFQTFRDSTDRIVRVTPPVIKGMPLNRLPFYVFNEFVMPPLGFIMFEVVRNPEDYYLNAFKIVCSRRRISSDPEIFRVATWQQKASVMCKVADLFATSCPYISDYGLWKDERLKRIRLGNAEEFTRTVRLTRSGDCEDFSAEILMTLADICTTEWKSEIMNHLQKARRQYIATIPLKTVTAPSASGQPGTVSLTAHNCVDLIPVKQMVRMLSDYEKLLDNDELSHELPHVVVRVSEDRLLQSRMKEILEDDLKPLVIEGTGMYKPDGGIDTTKKERRALVQSAGKTTFKNTRALIIEQPEKISGFYVAPVSSLVWDTFMLGGKFGQVFYLTVGGSCACVKNSGGSAIRLYHGALHNKYIQGDRSVIAYAAPPPDAKMLARMAVIEKFDHPIPVLEPPTTADSTIDAAVENVLNTAQKDVCSKDLKWVSWYYNSTEMTIDKATEIRKLVEKTPFVKGFRFVVNPITTGLTILEVSFGCEK
jgi:hypothetical protein